MKLSFPSLSQAAAAAICLLSANSAWAVERFHMESALPSQLIPASSAAALSSGGNVAQYPNAAGSIPHDSANQFFLAESTLGYCGPTTEGGVNTKAEMNSAASTILASGTFYKTTGVPGNWQIVFPGVVDLSTGGQAPGTQNFYADRVQSAVDYYRAVALAFPNDLQARINFINAMRDLMVPYSYAGNNAYARATKERIINGPLDIPAPPGQPDPANPTATDREDAALQNASGMYETAADQFVDLMGAADSFQTAFPGSLPAGYTESDSLVQQLRSSQKALCSTYARATGYKGETLLRSFQLRYLKKYGVPTLTAPIPTDVAALLTSIDTETRNLDYYLLVTAPLEGNSWFPGSEFAPPRAFLGNLRDLRYAMHSAFLTFAGLDGSLAIKSNAYGSEFVPFFFDPFIFPGNPTTFSGLSGFARPLATASENADTTSSSSIGQLDINLQTLAQRLNDINDQYNSQLGQLCGWKIVEINGVPTRTPDIDGAILPPEQRPDWQTRNRVDQGEIGLQWLEIDAAELAMENALLGLDNVLKTIDAKRETWKNIKGSRQDMIQNVILATGQKMAQLEKDAAEARAKFDEYKASQAKKKRKRGLFGSIFSAIPSIAGAIAAPFTGGASLLLTVATSAHTLASTYLEISNAYKDATAEIKTITTQAALERQLGEIAAKKEELAYLERANIQFQQIDEDGYRTEEAIHQLLLEVKSSELQIEMANLRVEREYTKLSTMLNRVAYLTQQHAASFSLVNTNPLNSPDFRLIRDRNIREAEERFIFAQEWAFLTGRAASYIALGSTRRSNIETINLDILKARTGKRLVYLLDRLQAEMNLVTIDLGSRASQRVTISLRDHVAQHNNVDRLANGLPDNSLPFPYEAQTANGQSGNSETLSDADWLQFLLDHRVFPGPQGGVLRLEIPFRLSLNRWADPTRPTSLPKNPFTNEAPTVENPLFSADRRGAVIFFSATNPEFFGTKVDILGNFTNINAAISPPTTRLSPEGASYIREQSYGVDPSGQSLRIFQLGANRDSATIEAQINGVGLSTGNRNAQLHERSPANDRWVLTIFYDATPNRRLLEQLDKIRDIRVSFSLSSFSQ